MKALSIHQPYAHAIVRGYKPVENRSWRPPRALWSGRPGPRLLVHAGKRKPRVEELSAVALQIHRQSRRDFDLVDRELRPAPLGAIVGSVAVLGYVTSDGAVETSGDPADAAGALSRTRASPWYTGDIGWVLSEPVAYEEPVACRGFQGVWSATGEVLEACLRQEEKSKRPRRQCKHCPWKVATDPRKIPNGYCEMKHAQLSSSIAEPGVPSAASRPRMMACHETPVGAERPCIGWLAHQLGPGNNIGLRLAARSGHVDTNFELDGEQHPDFESTLPKGRTPSASRSRRRP